MLRPGWWFGRRSTSGSTEPLEQLDREDIGQYQIVAEVDSNQDARAVQTNASFPDVNFSLSGGEPTICIGSC